MKRSNRALRFTFLILTIALAAIPMLFGMAAFAQSPSTPPPDYNLRNTACAAGLPCGDVSPALVIATIINVVVSVIGVVAVVMIVYGGALWMTAAGNEEKITQAKRLLVNAVIGLAIIMMAFAISSFVFSTLEQATIAPSAPADTCVSRTGWTCTDSCSTTSVTTPDCTGGQVCCAP